MAFIGILFLIGVPVFGLTSATVTTLALAEVEIKDGTAHATSVHSASWTADKAFSVGHNEGWHNKPDPITKKQERFPILVWYEFPAENSFIPGRVSFRARQDTDEGINQLPAQWQFVGSNDPTCGKFGKWTILCEDYSNNAISTLGWTKYCHVEQNILKRFKCLGINVMNSKNIFGSASLRDMRMWEKIID